MNTRILSLTLAVSALLVLVNATGFKANGNWKLFVGPDELEPAHLRKCKAQVANFNEKINGSGKSCRYQCMPFKESVKAVYDSLMQSRQCAIDNGEEEAYNLDLWNFQFSMTVRKGCAETVTNEYGEEEALFCVNSRIFYSTVALIGEKCIPGYMKDPEWDEEDEDKPGVIQCASNGDNMLTKKKYDLMYPSGARMAVASRGKHNESKVSLKHNERVSPCLCTNHHQVDNPPANPHWEPYASNQPTLETCDSFCANVYCVNNFLFSLCLAQSLSYAQTDAECDPSYIRRSQCYDYNIMFQ